MSQTVACSSAFEFLQLLRRIHPMWLGQGDWNANWIFRGQLDSDGALKPTAWRDRTGETEPFQLTEVDEQLIERAIRENPDLAQVDEQRAVAFIKQKRFERTVIHAYANHVDQLGLPLPGHRFPPLESPVRVCDARTLDAELYLELSALAQHHGLPTRLLDWTLNPTVAAFFAVERAAERMDDTIVVWALNRSYLRTTPDELRQFDAPVPDMCREIRVQRSQVGFLHAQEGTFTYLPESDRHFLKTGEWPSVEDLLEPAAFCKVTLPATEALEAERLLWADKVSRAHLMPNHDNVTKSLTHAWRRYRHEVATRSATRAASPDEPQERAADGKPHATSVSNAVSPPDIGR